MAARLKLIVIADPKPANETPEANVAISVLYPACDKTSRILSEKVAAITTGLPKVSGRNPLTKFE